MTNQKHFCTCKDTSCELNPNNHNSGCDPCISKNLKAGEIPSCFFHLIEEDISHLEEFTIESFVKLYLSKKQ